MQFFPFFMWCFEKETCFERKNLLRQLAFGLGGLVFRRENQEYLCVSNSEFKIPQTYSAVEHEKLNQLLWNADSDYTNMEKLIKQSGSLRKAERMRMVDQFVLKNSKSSSIAKRIKDIIVLAIVLKLVSTTDITFSPSNEEILSINGSSANLDDAFNKKFIITKAKICAKKENSNSSCSSKDCSIDAHTSKHRSVSKEGPIRKFLRKRDQSVED